MSLQNKRCKNPSETAMILLELGRRQKLNKEIGGTPVADDTLVNVLWMAMDRDTRSHVSIKVGDAAEIPFQVMKEAIMRHTSLAAATSGAAAHRPTAMDIGSIASVSDQAQSPGGGEAPAPVVDWPTDESGWPLDEEGNHIDGWIDGQLNFVKGKGKRKGECWNCGQKGHQAAQCTNPPSAGKGAYGYKGKGKGDSKGKGKGKGEC